MKLTSNWEQNNIYRIFANFHRKMISILTDLNVSSLACKSVFYRPKYNAKGVDLGTEY